MYNGIGLASVRGSATNGYVQRNMSFVRKDRQRAQNEWRCVSRSSTHSEPKTHTVTLISPVAPAVL